MKISKYKAGKSLKKLAPNSVKSITLFALVAVALVASGGMYVYKNYQRSLYAVSDAELKLLTDTKVDMPLIKETATGFSYSGQEENMRDGASKAIVASALDSTGELPYQATLPRDSKKGITFGDGDKQSFTMTAVHDLSKGRMLDGRVVYPVSTTERHAYTFKRNGIKEDILLTKSSGNTKTFKWSLETGDLEARLTPDGSVGLYSANPILSEDITIGDEKSKELIENAKKNGKKENLVFSLPKPFILNSSGARNYEDVNYRLVQEKGKTVLVLDARNLDNQTYPISIDPTVIVTTDLDFNLGYSGGDVTYPGSGDIERRATSGGTLNAWTINTNYFANPRTEMAFYAYNGFLYVSGGKDNTSDTGCSLVLGLNCDTVQYAAISSVDGSVGVFAETTRMPEARTDHAMIAYNGYMYVSGGSGTTTSVVYALICTGSNNGVGGCGVTAGTLGTWNTATSHVGARVDHGIAAYNGYMYASGGTGLTTNEYAKINADGSLGTWTATEEFSHDRASHGLEAYNGYMYAIGGKKSVSSTTCNGVNSLYCRDIVYARINDNGTLEPWVVFANLMTAARGEVTTAFSGGFLHAIGGRNAAYLASTEYAPVYADGTIGTWTATTSFTTARLEPGGAYYNGYMYVGGGVLAASGVECKPSGSSSYCSDVQYASATTTAPTYGTVGTATQQTNMFANTRTNHSTVAYNGYLYIIGGVPTTTGVTGCMVTYCDDVIRCPINANGSIGTCVQQTSAFTTARNLHSSVAYKGYLYIMGGQAVASGGSTGCDSVTGYCRDIQRCPISTVDGSISACTQQLNAFTGARSSFGASVYNGYIYLVGGYDGASLDDIHYCAVSTVDGSVTCTQQTAAFTNARTAPSAVTYNGYLYIIGGENGGTYYNDIQYCLINVTTGAAGTCTLQAAAFTTARNSHTSVAYNGYIYIAGGYSGAYQNDSQYCKINTNGTTDTCVQQAAAFTTARRYHGSAAYNGYIYITGGNAAGTYQNDIQRLPVRSPMYLGMYERIIDIGRVASTVQTVEFNGTAKCGGSVTYAVAGSDALFGSSTTRNNVFPSDDVTINVDSGRYVYVRVTLNDSICGGTTNITDITLTYIVRPDPPTLVAPSNTSIGHSALPTFQLRTTSLDSDNVQYKIDLCTTSNCSSILRTINQTASQTGWSGQNANTGTAYTTSTVIGSSTMASHTYQTPGLALGTQYWWRAYAVNAANSTSSLVSAISTFTTNYSPNAPTLSMPPNNDSGTPVSPEFRMSSTDTESDYVRYKIEICTVSDCSTLHGSPIEQSASQTGWKSQSTQSGTAYTSGQTAIHQLQTALSGSTQYWWRAYAIDPSGSNAYGAASAIWSFTTGSSVVQNQVRIKGNTNLNGAVNIKP